MWTNLVVEEAAFEETNRYFVFSICMPLKGRKIYLRASSEEDMNGWIRALRATLVALSSPIPSLKKVLI